MCLQRALTVFKRACLSWKLYFLRWAVRFLVTALKSQDTNSKALCMLIVEQHICGCPPPLYIWRRHEVQNTPPLLCISKAKGNSICLIFIFSRALYRHGFHWCVTARFISSITSLLCFFSVSNNCLSSPSPVASLSSPSSSSLSQLESFLFMSPPHWLHMHTYPSCNVIY